MTKQKELADKYRFIENKRKEIARRLLELKDATIVVEGDAPADGSPSASDFLEISLGDRDFFSLSRGRRVTKKDCNKHKGDVPTISGRGRKDSYLGFVSEDWLRREGKVYREPMVVIAANGSVGSVFLRDEPKYAVHDDAIGIVITNRRILPEDLQFALRASAARAQHHYGAKLYEKKLKLLTVALPRI